MGSECSKFKPRLWYYDIGTIATLTGQLKKGSDLCKLAVILMHVSYSSSMFDLGIKR